MTTMCEWINRFPFVTRVEEKECKHDCYIQRTKARVYKRFSR